MNRRGNKIAGFTLIELMIVVAILGILAAVAIPAFAAYIRRSKTGEAFATLDAMFKGVSTYYNRGFATGSSINSLTVGHCTVPEEDTFSGLPTDIKQAFESTPSFSIEEGIALPTGMSYYRFTNTGGLPGCNGATATSHYTLTALGDLDNDLVYATFALTTMSSTSNELYKAKSVFVVNELE